MSPLQIQNNNSNDFTLVSNRFLDLYMPETNGEFVKIYLYLLRSSVGQVYPPSLSSIADTLNCTEKDIERALKYWCKKKVLALDFDDKKHITRITFFDLDTKETQAASAVEAKASANTSTSAIGTKSNANTAILAEASASMDIPEETKVSTTTEMASKTVDFSTAKRTPSLPKESSLNASRVKDLKQNEDIVQLLFIAEQYLGKTLTPNETMKLLYFYEDLHFSPDLIEYLIEYCVSREHKSIRYIETVALAWHEEGITTVTAAKKSSDIYNKNYFSILKALGISNRNPVESEMILMNRWLNDFGFSLDIILEACNRTITTTGKTSFPYTDSILTSWYEAKVHSLSDVASLDKAHRASKPSSKAAAKTTSARSKTANKFNNFSQRNYDFEDLEKQLLKQQLQQSKVKE